MTDGSWHGSNECNVVVGAGNVVVGPGNVVFGAGNVVVDAGNVVVGAGNVVVGGIVGGSVEFVIGLSFSTSIFWVNSIVSLSLFFFIFSIFLLSVWNLNLKMHQWVVFKQIDVHLCFSNNGRKNVIGENLGL